MIEFKVCIKSTDDANKFVQKNSRFKDYDGDYIFGRYVIDFCSILGVLSVGIGKPCRVIYHCDNIELCNKYKEAVKSNSPESLVAIIKMIYQRKQKRIAQGKKSTATDAKYFQIAENLLYMELGMALGQPKEEVCKTIIDFINKSGQEDQSENGTTL